MALLFGGKSAEHEVSIQSAKNIFFSLRKDKYEITLIGIDKSGSWHKLDSSKLLEQKSDFKAVVTSNSLKFDPQELSSKKGAAVDVVFPILHGPNGEDGTVQGLLKLTGIPFVGAGVLGSAIGMDKDVQKRLLKEAGLPIAKFQTITHIKEKINIPFPIFVKPANMGSSVGVSKVEDIKELNSALKSAFSYDRKIIIEEEIKGREIEVSVVGNKDPKASLPGEVITSHDWYDYEAKYIDGKSLKIDIPAAKLSKEKIKEFQNLAIKVFKVLCCEGMARVDFFLTPNGKILVNELNTIPGFTNSSMYPKLWEASGLSQEKLVDELIKLAIQDHHNS